MKNTSWTGDWTDPSILGTWYAMPPLQVEDDAALPHQLYRIPAVHVRKTSDPFKSMAQAVFDSAESLPLLILLRHCA